jgi:hypothetical protein
MIWDRNAKLNQYELSQTMPNMGHSSTIPDATPVVKGSGEFKVEVSKNGKWWSKWIGNLMWQWVSGKFSGSGWETETGGQSECGIWSGHAWKMESGGGKWEVVVKVGVESSAAKVWECRTELGSGLGSGLDWTIKLKVFICKNLKRILLDNSTTQ